MRWVGSTVGGRLWLQKKLRRQTRERESRKRRRYLRRSNLGRVRVLCLLPVVDAYPSRAALGRCSLRERARSG